MVLHESLFEFVWGFLWGVIVTAAFIASLRRRRHHWKCPACEFKVAGNDQGLVDYVILEHSESHE